MRQKKRWQKRELSRTIVIHCVNAMTAVLVGALGQRFTRWWQSALAMAAGLLACYALGTAWFVAVYTQTKGPVGVGAALMWCVVPYLLPDAVKIALSVVLVQKLRPVLSRMGFERW